MSFSKDKITRAILLENAVPYQYCLDIKNTKFKILIDEIYKRLEDKGSFPKRGSKERQLHQLKIIIANLLRIYQIGHNPYLRFPRRDVHFKKTRYVPKLTSFRSAKYCFEGLNKLNLIEVNKGFSVKGKKHRQTRISTSKGLISIFDKYDAKTFEIKPCLDETILLRNDKKQLIDYRDTPETNMWRDNLKKINERLQEYHIDLYIKDDEIEIKTMK